MSQRAVVEAAWGAVTSSVVRRDPAAAGAAVPAAVREGLLQTAEDDKPGERDEVPAGDLHVVPVVH